MAVIIIAGLAAIGAFLILLPSPPRGVSGRYGLVAVALAALAVALLLVGVVSNTFVRHVVQIVPLIAALATWSWRREWAVIAAAPLFVFWLLVMVSIWLFLLGIARIFTGTFTSAEIALTVVIALSAAAGLFGTFRQQHPSSLGPKAAVVLGFTMLQLGAMVISFLPAVARR